MTLVEIFSGNIMQAKMLQDMLTKSNIESYMKDEIMGSLMPWVVSPGGTSPVRLMVSEHDYEEAIQIVHEFETSGIL